jgi:glycosyltransferase involved in cell wall biosynthesis
MSSGVHQFHPAISRGDAISDYVLSIQRLLRGLGYRSEVFCERRPPHGRGHLRAMGQYGRWSSSSGLLLLHYSLGYSVHVMDWLRRLPDRKVLIYHNITPHHYFAGINPVYLRAAERGRRDLNQLGAMTEAGWGVSDYNCEELRNRGWTEPGVLPIVFEPKRYRVRPDRRVMRNLQGGPNVLSVGRIAPNKRLEDLIQTFYFLKRFVRPQARLLVVGSSRNMEPYLEFLRALVRELELADVIFTGHVNARQLVAYYQCADVYVSMSEHEGFGVPLLESMHFGVPIIAYKAAAIPETLGGSGILVTRKDFPAMAELIGLLCEDDALRDQIVFEQRQRLRAFLPVEVEGCLRALLAALGM